MHSHARARFFFNVRPFHRSRVLHFCDTDAAPRALFRCNSKRNSDTLLRYSLLLTSPVTTLGNRQPMDTKKRRGEEEETGEASPSASRIFNAANGPRGGNTRRGNPRLGIKPGLISNNQVGRMSHDWRKHWSLMDWTDSSCKRARYSRMYTYMPRVSSGGIPAVLTLSPTIRYDEERGQRRRCREAHDHNELPLFRRKRRATRRKSC